MRKFRDIPINRKLTLIIMLTSIAGLLLACTTFVIYDYITFRNAMVRDLSILAEMTGYNIQSFLMFGYPGEAQETLRSLKTDPHIVSSRLYKKYDDGSQKVFDTYIRDDVPDDVKEALLPSVPQEEGHRFEDGHLALFRKVVDPDSKEIGTIYIQSDMQELYSRLNRYAIIVVIIMIASSLVALLLSHKLRRVISEPVVELAQTMGVVSINKNYSIRALKYSEDEIGLLIDGFNEMLTQIQRRDGALRESEERYRVLFESATEGIVIADIRTKKFKYANPAICRMLGYSVEELIGKSVSDIHPKDKLEHVISEFEAQARGEKILAPNIPCLRQDGTIIYADINTTKALIDRVECNIGFFRDVTARKQAEEELTQYREHLEDLVKERTAELTHVNEQLKQEIAERVQAEKALRESEEKFRAISVSAQDSIIMIDNEGNISFWNEAAERIFGYSRQEALGQEMHMFLAPERYHDAYREGFGRFKTTGQGVGVGKTLELVAVRKDGTEFPIELSLSALKLRDLWHAIGIVRDITERKQAEEKLKLYHQIFMGSSDVISITNPEGYTIERNPAHQLYYGYSDEEVIDQHASVYFNEAEAKGIAQSLAEKDYFRGEIEMRSKDGTIYYTDLSISPVRNDDGELICYVGMGRDISEVKQALDELEKAYRELRETQSKLVQSEKMASLGRLVAGVAHEFNNPISAVQSSNKTLELGIGKLETLCKENEGSPCQARPEFKKLLRAIENCQKVVEEGTERVATIVQRMKAFARLDEAELQLTNVHQCIEDTLHLLPRGWEERINLVSSYGQVPDFFCYPAQVNQALYNVLLNAVEAIEGEGEIRIQTRMEDDFVAIAIEDTGMGIPPDVKERIFDPGITTKSRGIGTGLGLAICYQIIEEHKGKIEVESVVGAGSRFTLFLPLNLRRSKKGK